MDACMQQTKIDPNYLLYGALQSFIRKYDPTEQKLDSGKVITVTADRSKVTIGKTKVGSTDNYSLSFEDPETKQSVTVRYSSDPSQQDPKVLAGGFPPNPSDRPVNTRNIIRLASCLVNRISPDTGIQVEGP